LIELLRCGVWNSDSAHGNKMIPIHAPFPLAGRRTLLLADGEFSTFGSKTANCYLRYRPDEVVAVLDHVTAGQTVQQVLGFGGEIPVVEDVQQALAFGTELVIVGVAPRGGQLVPDLRRQIMESVRAGLDVVSGLHTFLTDDPSVVKAAERSGSGLWDVRWVPELDTIGSGNGCVTGAKTVLVCGTDCNVGKMTATLELHRQACEQGVRAAWAATGQTGMMLRERGVAIDRVVADFIGGAAEALVNYEGRESDIVFVEGQGSLFHTGYAGVTLGLLFGVMPDAIVLAHAATRETSGDSDVPLPPLRDIIDIHEALMRPFKPCPVVAIAVNTAGLESSDARAIIERVSHETGLPAADPIRDGATDIVERITAYLAGTSKDGK
jgi:uncharacterized NAD-dependent epimerase/dehydratase family protein